jgi:acetyl-CoA synthetase
LFDHGKTPQAREVDVLTDLLDGGLTSGQIVWRPYQEPGRDAVDVHWLFTAEDTGAAEAYIANQLPDSHTDEHRHPGFELVFVLEGEIGDDQGGVYRPGSLLVQRPGTTHRMSSSTGCKVLVFRQHRVTPVPAPSA